MLDPVAAEGRRAADLKESERFTVVIGNPPYDREQRDTDGDGRRKGGVVRYGAPRHRSPRPRPHPRQSDGPRTSPR